VIPEYLPIARHRAVRAFDSTARKHRERTARLAGRVAELDGAMTEARAAYTAAVEARALGGLDDPDVADAKLQRLTRELAEVRDLYGTALAQQRDVNAAESAELSALAAVVRPGVIDTLYRDEARVLARARELMPELEKLAGEARKITTAARWLGLFEAAPDGYAGPERPISPAGLVRIAASASAGWLPPPARPPAVAVPAPDDDQPAEPAMVGQRIEDRRLARR